VKGIYEPLTPTYIWFEACSCS